jgi:glyoxylase-like metal-dependent hydrolase (beta-lactamase superfamily II)
MSAFIFRQPEPVKPYDLKAKWIHGSRDCANTADPPIQVHRFNANTYILRQSKCLNFEGPFLYLLIGEKSALLLDSGAAPPGGQSLPIRQVVDDIIFGWLAAHNRTKIDLIVAHSHSHRDHVYGDAQFKDRAHTTTVTPDLAAIKNFFGLSGWPNDQAGLDLGGRILTVIPTPGHEKTHVAIYDNQTGLLLTGDMLYPGFLTIDDWPSYRRSVRRLSEFAASHKVSHILGAHIEMTSEPRKMYPLGSTFQPDEHVLELDPGQLLELQKAVDALGDSPREDIHDQFILHPRKVG